MSVFGGRGGRVYAGPRVRVRRGRRGKFPRQVSKYGLGEVGE